MPSSHSSSSSPLVQNIRKTEKLIILPNHEEKQGSSSFSLQEKQQLWNDQVETIRSAILTLLPPSTNVVVAASPLSHSKNQQQQQNSARREREHDEIQHSHAEQRRIHDLADITVILDIEGTITPLYFVTKILFPYFVENCDSFIRKNLTENVLKQAVVAQMTTEQKQEQEATATPATLSHVETEMIGVALDFINYCEKDAKIPCPTANWNDFVSLLIKDSLEHTNANRKIPYMKKLQGICWHAAYVDGSIAGDIFSDVVLFFDDCSNVASAETNNNNNNTNNTTKIRIYSSGSVFAQKLLLGHSRCGNLLRYIDGFDDTVTAGMKNDPESYKKIFEKSSTSRTNTKKICIFVSDSLMELRSCKYSGLPIIPVFAVRPQNPIQDNEEEKGENGGMEFPSLFSFLQLSEVVFGVHNKMHPFDIEDQIKTVHKDVEKYSAVNEKEEREAF